MYGYGGSAACEDDADVLAPGVYGWCVIDACADDVEYAALSCAPCSHYDLLPLSVLVTVEYTFDMVNPVVTTATFLCSSFRWSRHSSVVLILVLDGRCRSLVAQLLVHVRTIVLVTGECNDGVPLCRDLPLCPILLFNLSTGDPFPLCARRRRAPLR